LELLVSLSGTISCFFTSFIMVLHFGQNSKGIANILLPRRLSEPGKDRIYASMTVLQFF
jgi:hypothetical protein